MQAIIDRYDKQLRSDIDFRDQLECIQDSKLNLNSEEGRNDYRGIRIEYVACLEEKSSDECLPIKTDEGDGE